MHPIGIGTWDIASVYDEGRPEGRYGYVHSSSGNESEEISGIQFSLQNGQNHIDCAELYGAFYTDEVVGRAIASQGFMPREDLYIADKLWKCSVEPGAVKPVVEQMLSKLQTSYLDLLYIHAPWDGVDWLSAVPQIDDLIDEGLVRHFGVSNFTVDQMEKAGTAARNPIAANQMNFNCLYTAEVDEEFKRYCEDHQIEVVAYQPVKRGEVLTNEVLLDVARAHAATPAQVAIAWLLAVGAVPIPKAIKNEHISENLQAMKIELTADDLSRIAALST